MAWIRSYIHGYLCGAITHPYLNFNNALAKPYSMVSCQKGPTRHAYAWQIGPFWQDTLDM